MEEILQFSMEGRKRVKDQLFRIDKTYAAVNFAYVTKSGEERKVAVLEELEHKKFYNLASSGDSGEPLPEASHETLDNEGVSESVSVEDLPATHIEIRENQKGVSYDEIIVPYLKGAKKIAITDPYVRLFYQLKNLMELLESIVRQKEADEEVEIELVTVEEAMPEKAETQKSSLDDIVKSMERVGIKFSWELVDPKAIHARHIITDTGWKISLDRGLDIFQYYALNDQFSLEARLQEHRPCKPFEITYIRV